MPTTRLSESLALSCYQLCLSDEVWRTFGFGRRPRWSGSLFRPFRSSEANLLEPAIYLELLRLGLANVAFALRSATLRRNAHALLANVMSLVLDGMGDSRRPWEFTVRYVSFDDFVQDVTSGAAEYTSTPGQAKDMSFILLSHGPITLRSAFVRWIEAGAVIAASPTLLQIRAALREHILEATQTETVPTPLQAPAYSEAAATILVPMYQQ